MPCDHAGQYLDEQREHLMSLGIDAGDPAGKSTVDSKSGLTVTWPIKDKDTGAVIGTVVRQSDGVHQCVLPDGTIVESFTTHQFAMDFLHRRGQAISAEELAARLKADV